MVLGKLAKEGVKILSVIPQKESLESMFLKEITRKPGDTHCAELTLVDGGHHRVEKKPQGVNT